MREARIMALSVGENTSAALRTTACLCGLPKSRWRRVGERGEEEGKGGGSSWKEGKKREKVMCFMSAGCGGFRARGTQGWLQSVAKRQGPVWICEVEEKNDALSCEVKTSSPVSSSPPLLLGSLEPLTLLPGSGLVWSWRTQEARMMAPSVERSTSAAQTIMASSYDLLKSR